MTTNKNPSNKDIYDAINDFRQEMKNCYVTIERYAPVEKLVYGTVGVMGILIVTALVGLVIIK